MSGYDQRSWYIRAGPTKDLEYCRFVDEDFQRRDVDVVNDWRLTLVGAGSGALVDDLACGVYKMTTGALAANSCILDRANIRIVDPSLAPLLCVRARITAVAGDAFEVRIGLVDVWNTDHCVFEIDRSVHGDLSIYAESYNAGAQTENVDTGTDIVVGTWYIYEIFVDTDGTPYWYIDGVQENVGDAADVDPAEFFQPYVEIHTEDANARVIDTDFIKGWQRRA